jgi:hypothetical protein
MNQLKPTYVFKIGVYDTFKVANVLGIHKVIISYYNEIHICEISPYMITNCYHLYFYVHQHVKWTLFGVLQAFIEFKIV